MTKARLHWFWRGAIAAVMGLATGYACILLTRGGPAVLGQAAELGYITTFYAWDPWATGTLVVGPALVVTLGVFGLLTRWFGSYADGELHCRRCNHILRGLSEPRCPECGEGI